MQRVSEAQFEELCAEIDRIDFRRTPYRGAVQRVAKSLGRDAATVSLGARKHRSLRYVLALIKEVRRIDAQIQEAACSN